MTQPTTPTAHTWNVDVPNDFCITDDWRGGRARVRVLDGTEDPVHLWTIGDWTVGVCGWPSSFFGKKYNKRSAPHADLWVRVISPSGMHFMLQNRRPSLSVCDACLLIGLHLHDAITAEGLDCGRIPFSKGIELDLKLFCIRVTAGSFYQAIRKGDRERAARALRAQGSFDDDRILTTVDGALAAHAFGMTMSFAEAITQAGPRKDDCDLRVPNFF